MRIVQIIQGKRQYMLLLLSVLFIIIGFINEENQIVLNKAIYICLECIGVG